MDVLGSRMEQLGYDQTERSGVAWRTGTTSGTIQRSTFAGNWNGVYLQGSRNLRVEDNVFRHNARHGMVLAVGCSNATVRGNQSYANAGHGMVVVQGSNDVTLAGNEVHDNQQTGIDVNNSLACLSSPATSSTATTSPPRPRPRPLGRRRGQPSHRQPPDARRRAQRRHPGHRLQGT
jgi:parallel beta-helix repeat protein